MKQILFTGITGQLGSALSKDLIEKRIPAICFIRNPLAQYAAALSRFEILKADITDREAIFKYSKQLRNKVDVLVHMATARPHSPKHELFKTILKGSINLYDFANEIRCPKYIYFSSIAAVGPVPPGINYIDEEWIPRENQLDYFGKMKLETERSLIRLSKNNFTKTIILRPGNIYGPPKLSFIKFVVDMLRNKKKIFYHRAKNSVMWAPVYIQDVIDCVFILLKSKTFNNQIYFLTGPEDPTLEYLTHVISEIIDIPIENTGLKFYEKAHLIIRKGVDLLRYIRKNPSFPDFIYYKDKLKRDFGFYPKVKLEEGIPHTLRWALAKKNL